MKNRFHFFFAFYHSNRIAKNYILTYEAIWINVI
jgi:hypothetical protein